MNRNVLLRTPVARQRQRGISLLVVLILLVVMSILGLAVLRSSAMQERMSANMVDRNEALQAAETGLQVAQRTVINGTFNAMWDGSKTFSELRTTGSMTCAGNGVCDRSDPAATTTWESAPGKPTSWVTMANGARYGYTVEFLGRVRGDSGEASVCDTTSAPVYLCKRPIFRVTSYGRGRGLAQAVLQANILSQAR